MGSFPDIEGAPEEDKKSTAPPAREEASRAAPSPEERRERRRSRDRDLDEDLEPPRERPRELVLPEGPKPAVYHERIPFEHLDPDAVKVVRRLTRHGFQAYLVGGSVRDLLLGRQPKDFDVATSARPEEVRRLFRNCRVIGRRFRLAHILFTRGKVIETATFRRDPTQGEIIEIEDGEADDGVRLAPVKPRVEGDLLIRQDNVFGLAHEDAIRRDFTINGLFYDVDQDVVLDYVGGVPDVKRKIVRTIGDADVRLREDPVRILRAIKFSARLDFGMEPDLYEAIIKHRGVLERSARPRVLEEILRLLRGGAAHRSVYLMWDTGVLAVVLPELASYLDDQMDPAGVLWKRLDAIDRLEKRGNLPSDAVLLAALLHGPLDEWMVDARDPSIAFEEFFDDVAIRLAVPRRIKDRIRSIAIAMRRLEIGKLGALPRRDFFREALTLYAIAKEARGEPLPDWALHPPGTEIEPGAHPGPRRRRRRRRR
jgi:poly(A) polymerase